MVKRDGRRESFDRTKLAMGLRRAIAKRPIDAEQINALLSNTLRRIENEFDSEVPSRAIADAIMQRLRKVDAIAWLRYASFYQDFHGLSPERFVLGHRECFHSGRNCATAAHSLLYA